MLFQGVFVLGIDEAAANRNHIELILADPTIDHFLVADLGIEGPFPMSLVDWNRKRKSSLPTARMARFGFPLSFSMTIFSFALAANAVARFLSATGSLELTKSSPSGPRISLSAATSNDSAAAIKLSAASFGVANCFCLFAPAAADEVSLFSVAALRVVRGIAPQRDGERDSDDLCRSHKIGFCLHRCSPKKFLPSPAAAAAASTATAAAAAAHSTATHAVAAAAATRPGGTSAVTTAATAHGTAAASAS